MKNESNGLSPAARLRRLTITVAALAILAAACTVPPGTLINDDPVEPESVGDPALQSYSVLPPGNGNTVGFTSAWSDDQRGPYDRLIDVVADGALTDDNLGRYFKAATLGTVDNPSSEIVKVETPEPGVEVAWDNHGVPHITGDTEHQVGFGSGWAVAEGRMFVADLARILGRTGTIEMIGGFSHIDKAFTQIGTVPAINYTDDELNASIEAVMAGQPDGKRMQAATEGFVDGINAWKAVNPMPAALVALGVTDHHWTLADVVAVGITVDDIFGSGGGDEVSNAEFRRQLTDEFGEPRASELYEMLRMRDDPAATTHVEQPFPYPLFADTDTGPAGTINRINPAANVVLDPEPDMAKAPARPPSASNYVAISGERSANGHPVLVGGPQSAYIAPQLLFEMELHGAGYDARGITFPGLGPWVIIGRSRDYAWTATAGGSDLVDQRIKRLCEPDGSDPTAESTHYMFNGDCLAMTRPDPTAAWRTVHGPVVGDGTVDGEPVAVSQQRASRGLAANAVPSFWKLNQGEVSSGADFARVMSDVPMSFNWVYVDSQDIAFFHSGKYPIRATGVNPDMPTWGTGEWEWKGFLDYRRQPQVVNPSSGYLISWNNRIAPQWQASDGDWGIGSVQRVDMLRRRVESVQNAEASDLVTLVQEVATTDMRGEAVLPPALTLIEGAALTPQVATAASDLRDWIAGGSQRRDRDNNGFYDAEVIPIADRFHAELLKGVFEPGLGRFFSSDDLRRPSGTDNAPGLIGSSFQGGWYSLLFDDLTASAAGKDSFCGSGSSSDCTNVIAEALTAAVSNAGPYPQITVGEHLRFLPLITNATPMRWQNRPTYQQVVSFGD